MSCDPNLLATVVAALRQGLSSNLVAAVLFGSRARGEAGKASDWDLLIIARNLPERTLERHMMLKNLLPVAWRGQASIIAKTPKELESYLPSLLLDIALDGVILYDPHGYAAERLASLRRLIKEQGLHRERVQDDLVWRWERFPGFEWALEWEEAR